MKNTAQIRIVPALAGLGLLGLLCSPVTPVKAQGPQPGGQFNNRRMPFAFGTVTAVDAAAKTITVSSPFGGTGQTIQTQTTTSIVSQGAATAPDLKVGDQVQIQGIPTGITASSVTVGQSPLPSMGGGRGFGGPGGAAGNGGGTAGAVPQVKAQASATGTVTSTNPLTISLGQGISVTLKLAADAKVTKFSPLPLSSIKVGDRIVSSGQTNDNGTFTATSVGVNLDMGAMGMGQRGGGWNGGQGGGWNGGRGRGNRGGGGNGGFGGPGGGGPGGGPGGFSGPGGGGPGGPGGFGGPGGPAGEPAPPAGPAPGAQDEGAPAPGDMGQ